MLLWRSFLQVVNEACTQWAISPKLGSVLQLRFTHPSSTQGAIFLWPGVFLPLRIAYLVADCAEDGDGARRGDLLAVP